MKKQLLTFLPGLALFVGMAVAGAAGEPHPEEPDAFEDAVVLGEEDLAERAEILRNRYRRMTPGDAPLVQDAGTWPAAWEEFSPVWDGAAAERDLGTWTVPVEAERDGADTVLRDGDGPDKEKGRKVSNLYFDVNAVIRVPEMQDDGLRSPEVDAPFDVRVMHELLGHAASWFSGDPWEHPRKPWNEYDSDDPRVDPIIERENEYRIWKGYPRRYPKYWRH